MQLLYQFRCLPSPSRATKATWKWSLFFSSGLYCELHSQDSKSSRTQLGRVLEKHEGRGDYPVVRS